MAIESAALIGPTVPAEWATWAQKRLAGLVDQVQHVGPPTLLDPWDAAIWASVVEVLSDPARWARGLGLPEPLIYTNTTTLLLKHAANQAIPGPGAAPDEWDDFKRSLGR